MKINNIVYQNYKLLADTTLEVKQGLFYIGGINKDVAGASSNMSGKTTLGEGLVFALYGTDLQGKAANASVVRSGETSCQVSVSFATDTGGTLTVCRSRNNKPDSGESVMQLFIIEQDKDNNVTSRIGGAAADYQKYIDEKFGTCALFLAAHIFAYTSTAIPFAESTDKEQKRLFNLLVNASDLDAALEVAKSKKAALLQDKQKQQQTLLNLEGKIASIQERLQADVSNDIQAAEAKHKSALKLFNTLDAEAKKLDKAHTEFVDSMQDILTETNKLRNDAVNLASIKQTTVSDITATLSFFQEAKQKLSSLQDGVCPTCGSVVSVETKDNLLQSYEANITTLQKQIVQAKDELQDVRNSLREADETLSSIQTDIANSERNKRQAENNANTARLAVGAEAKIVQSLKDAANRDKQALQDALTKALEQTSTINAAITSIDDSVVIYAFWESAFGQRGIRSYRLDMITPVLNKFAAKYSDMLFGDGTVLRYSTQTQTKKTGEYRDQFEVALYKQKGASCKKIDIALSAGQAMRRDIIHSFAMMELAHALGKHTVDICMLDELFVTVDAKGIYSVIDALDELTAIAGTIWVIEHNDDLYAHFQNAIFVTRENNVASITEQ